MADPFESALLDSNDPFESARTDKPQSSEGFLKRAMGIGGKAVSQAFSPPQFNPQHPIASAIESTTGFQNAPGLGALQSAERARGSIIEDAAGGPGLGSTVLNIATDPMTYLGGGGVGKSAGKSAMGIPKAIAESKPMSIFRAPGVLGKRIEDITQRATKEEGALKGFQDFRTGQIREEGNKLIQAATKQAESATGPSTESIQTLQSEIQNLTKRATSLEERTLPQVAFKSGKNTASKIRSVVTKEGEKWNQGLEKLLGKDSDDIMIDPSRIESALTKTLEDAGVFLQESEDGLKAATQISGAENKILNMLNSVRKQQTGYGIKQVLRDKKLLGNQVKFGRQWGKEDFILNNARKNISQVSEDVVPGLKEHNMKWKDFTEFRNKAVKDFDVYGGRFSKSGRPFIEKTAKGALEPEELVFKGELESRVGKFSEQAEQVTKGVQAHKVRIENLGRQIADLDEASKVGRKVSEAQLSNLRNTINDSVESEIKKLSDLTTQDIVRLQNKTGASLGRLNKIREESVKKISKLKNIGKGVAIAGGLTSLLSFGKAVYSTVNE